MNALIRRAASGERCLGTFVKTNSHQTIEILALAGLDFVVIDAEHAPFGPRDLDIAILAARSRGLPALVRVPDRSPAAIGMSLDLGADGVLVPHVLDAGTAQAVRRAAKFAGGSRGLSPSPRSGDYGGIAAFAYAEAADAGTSLWCQIEDGEAVAQAEAIARVEGVDCLFIGRVDLVQSLGETSVDSPAVNAAVELISAAGRIAGKPVAMFVSSPTEIAPLAERGISIFVVGSDQALLRNAASTLVEAARRA